MKLIDKRDPQTYAIIGACMEIHRQLGHGFLESVYQEAATVEFPLRTCLKNTFAGKKPMNYEGNSTVSGTLTIFEITSSNIAYEREVSLPIKYKKVVLPTHYRADFICFGEIIVEFKALSHLSGIEEAQLLNYLKATRLNRGL